MGGTLPICENTTIEHGLKDIAFYIQKYITPCTVVITSLLVCNKPLGAPASVKRVNFQLGSIALAGGKFHRIAKDVNHKTVSEIKRFKIATTYLGSQWVNTFRLFLPWPMIIHYDVIEENAQLHPACLGHVRFIIVPQNSPVHNNYSPSGEQPEQHILAPKL